MDIAVDVVCAYLSAWQEIFANHKYNQTTQHNKGDNATQRTLTTAQAANNLNPISHGLCSGSQVGPEKVTMEEQTITNTR